MLIIGEGQQIPATQTRIPAVKTLLRDWLTTTWWSYGSDRASWFSAAYHWFNLGEGAAWCLLAALVARRFARNRYSPLDLIYAAAFVTFGASDFREAFCLQTWLIAAKGANLVLLLAFRRNLLRRFYPASRSY